MINFELEILLSIKKKDYVAFWNIINNEKFIKRYLNLDIINIKILKDKIGTFWINYIKDLEKNKGIGKIEDLLKIEGYYDYTEFDFIKRKTYFTNIKKIAFIGSGYNPETAIKIKNIFIDASIYCIDADLDAINHCNNKIKDNQIIFINSKGEDFNYKGYNFIFLANGLINKNKIINKILNDTEKETFILLRNPILTGELLYEKVYLDNINGVKLVGKIQTSDLSETLILKNIKC